MDKESARQIAELVVQNLWASKAEFILGLVIWAVVAAVGAYVGTWMAKRAEADIADRRYERISEQLKRTTLGVEEIRAAVAHEEWTEREWKGIRIKNLEQFMSYVLETMASHVQFSYDLRMAKEDQRLDPSSAINARTLQHLFYPELAHSLDAFMDAAVGIKTRARSFYWGVNGLDEEQRTAARTETAQQYDADVLALQNALGQLTEDVKLMTREIFNRHRPERLEGGDDAQVLGA